MRVKDLMETNIKLIQPDTTLKEAAEQMRDGDCGYLPVGENDRLTGAVTDRDIVVRGIAAGHDPNDATVKDIMTQKVVYCFEDDEVEQAAEKMKREQIRRLVVINSDKRLTGILSIGDIARGKSDSKMSGDIENTVAA